MARRLLPNIRMNTQAIAFPSPDIAPALPRATEAANAVSFGAMLAPTNAPSISSETPHDIAASAKAAVARAQRAVSDKKSSNDNPPASTAAIAPQPLQQAASQAGAPTSAAAAAAASSTSTAPGLLAGTTLAGASSDVSGAAADPATALANSIAAPPASGTSTSSSSTVQFGAMAAELSARIAAGAPGLASQPRVALADLAALQDKLGGADANHSALSLETLQGMAKSPTPADAAMDEKLLADAAKDIAAATTSLEPATTGSASDQASGTAPADTSTSIDAGAASAMAPPPPPPVAAAPAPLSPTTLSAAGQIALALPQAFKSGDNHIQIQLQPAELGAIDVKLNVNHDGRVTMVVSADRSDTLNLLRQDSGALTQALRDAGLQADSSSLSFNLRGGFNQQASNGGTAAGGTASSSAEPDDITVPAGALQRRHAGSLDIHV
jgi:flagellar hook-length control protein FliK